MSMKVFAFKECLLIASETRDYGRFRGDESPIVCGDLITVKIFLDRGSTNG
jgi:hypothetical protein